MNGNFNRYYEEDMQRMIAKEEFMSKFGDPLEGLDLSKKTVTFYPSYFVLRRIIFVFGSLYLWNRPLLQLSLGVLMGLTSFCLLV